MKTFKYCLIVILLNILSVEISFAQQIRLTWPVDGSIFQQNSSGTANIQIAVQAGYGWQNNANLADVVYYTIQELKPNGECKTVDSQGFCTSYRILSSGYPSNGLNSTTKLFSNWTSQTTDWKTATDVLSNLPKGWYRLKINYLSLFTPITIQEIKFGVGDVYFIAGQSNSSGYGGLALGEKDDEKEGSNFTLQSYYSGTNINFEQQNAVRSIPVTDVNILYNQGVDGIPFEKKFSRLDNGTSTNPRGIYPNGRDSWYWSIFADKVSKANSMPVLIFNCGSPGTSVSDWYNTGTNGDNTTLFQKLRSSLQMYGGTFGVKGILWHQGENDCANYSYSKAASNTNPNPNFLQQYKSNLQELIKLTRKSLTNDVNSTSLNWYLSNVSYMYNGPVVDWDGGISNNSGKDPSIKDFTIGCSASSPYINYYKTSLNLIAKQNEIIGSGTNIFKGVESDTYGECYRASRQRVHFTGNSSSNGLEMMADAWYNAIFDSNGAYKNGANGSISARTLLSLSVSKDGSNNYVLTAPSGYSKYFWVTNNGGLYSTTVTNSNIFSTNQNSSSVPVYYTCYVSNASDNSSSLGWDLYDLKATIPFIMKNTYDNNLTYIAPEEYNVSPSSFSFVKNYSVPILQSNVSGVPTWISVTGYGTSNLTFNVSSNNAQARSSEINVSVSNSPSSFTNKITVNQSQGGSACTTTTLVSMYPTSVSMPDFGTLHFNQSVIGNTMQVGGYKPNNGLGTHANSNIKYNISGLGYVTFSGSVGRDDESDNCNCGTQKLQFVIKADGQTLFTSSLLGTTDGKQPFSVNITNKNVLELIVNDGGDNFYGDHADWMDLVLSCSTPPSCTTPNPPTAITSTCNSPVSPNTSCTLQTTCASGSTATWSTAQTGNSITVSPASTITYSVKCVNGTCESSSVSKTISVTTSGCSAVVDGLVMGTWTVTGQQLKVRYFDSKYWLTQVVSTSPDAFVVRGSAMLQRTDVTLNNSSYSGLTNCFYYVDGGIQGLTTPTDFSTPSGYSLSYSGSTPVYTASGTPPSCTNTDLTNNWFYASSDVNPPPKINTNQNGTAININGTTYSKGIGTHAFSEIIYDLGTSHNFEYFKADVGRDLGSATCGCGGQTIIFKVLNANTNAVLAGPITKGNGQSATPISASISGVSKIKLVVEDGGDNNWGDWADWANARLTCPSGARIRSDLMEEIKPQNFTLSPNPVDDQLNVKFSVDDYSKVTFEVIDINGRKLDNYSFMAEKGNHNFSIDVTGISPGMYFVRAFISSKTGDTSPENLKTEVIRFMIER